MNINWIFIKLAVLSNYFNLPETSCGSVVMILDAWFILKVRILKHLKISCFFPQGIASHFCGRGCITCALAFFIFSFCLSFFLSI